jgi:predicted nucleotidyltransferase component of viral defense system
VIDIEKIQSTVDKYGFQTDMTEKVYRLTNLLQLISITPYLRERLALKGGTAINFLYFQFPRLSVDIDLDFTMNVPPDQMLAEKKDLSLLIEETLIKTDYHVQKSGDVASLKFHLQYHNMDRLRDNIKLEMNFLSRSHVLEPQDQPFYSPFEENPVMIRSLQKEEIFGQKMKALLERTTARDLYDAYQLINRLEREPNFLNFDLLHKVFIYYACSAKHDYRNLRADRIYKIDENEINTMLIPVLTDSESFELHVVQNKVEDFLNRLLPLKGSENDFVELFYNQAQYRPELLFNHPFDKLSEVVKKSPAIEWKLHNLRKMLELE